MLCQGFGFALSEVMVPRLDGSTVMVGSFENMVKSLAVSRIIIGPFVQDVTPVPYTHLRAHETVLDLVCRLLLEKKNYYSSYTLPSHLI